MQLTHTMEYTKKGHFYSTITKANNAINKINLGERIPNNGFITQTYCVFKECVGGYYLDHDETTEKYLGLPTDITIQANL